jgi:hypothetical protein
MGKPNILAEAAEADFWYLTEKGLLNFLRIPTQRSNKGGSNTYSLALHNFDPL